MNAKLIWITVTNWPRVQMNVARTRASVKLDTLEMDLIVITAMQVRCAEKQLEIQCYSPLCLTNLGLSLTRNVGKAAKRKFGVRNSILNRKLAFFSNYKKRFWASYQSQKIRRLEDWFFIFFLVHVKCIPYVTTEFKFYYTIPEVLINIRLSKSQKWTSFLSHEPCLYPASPTNFP